MTRCSEGYERLVETPVGLGRVTVDVAVDGAQATFVVGHGAGGGIDARDLLALRDALPRSGVTVVRVEQPWRLAGRRLAPAPRQLDTAWLAVVEDLAGRDELQGVLVLGGRSAGARVACRTARVCAAAGVVALAFPLHPPGKPERSRLGELEGAGVPVLVVQGERDPFGRPEEFPPETSMHTVPGADHGFAVPKSATVTQQQALDGLAAAVTTWLSERIADGAGATVNSDKSSKGFID